MTITPSTLEMLETTKHTQREEKSIKECQMTYNCNDISSCDVYSGNKNSTEKKDVPLSSSGFITKPRIIKGTIKIDSPQKAAHQCKLSPT
jgi:hypothetical protein